MPRPQGRAVGEVLSSLLREGRVQGLLWRGFSLKLARVAPSTSSLQSPVGASHVDIHMSVKVTPVHRAVLIVGSAARHIPGFRGSVI